MVLLQMAKYINVIFNEISTEHKISTSPHYLQGGSNDERYAPLISQFNKSISDNEYTTSPITDWKTRKKGDEKELHYHDYTIFIIMYHKTGYVLTRQLKYLVTKLELETLAPHELDKLHLNRNQRIYYGTDRYTGERYAFDTIGGWTRSAFAPRRHFNYTYIPRGYRNEPMRIHSGRLYLQESPDLFCSVKELKKTIKAPKAKIIHFVRNPFDMLLSNYKYHSQDPSPEKWVHEDDPCYDQYENGETLASIALPSIGTDEINEEYFSNITKMCKSLFQTNSSLWNATFYEHLLNMNSYDGLRLASAQMIAASSIANKHLAGGDVVRMANNIVKLKELQEYAPSRVEILTLSTEEFITSTANSTMKFLDFIFGSNNTVISKEKRLEAAQSRQKNFDREKEQLSKMKKEKLKKAFHVTQSTTQKEKETKEKLQGLLREDKHLAPILRLTEKFVNDALARNA